MTEVHASPTRTWLALSLSIVVSLACGQSAPEAAGKAQPASEQPEWSPPADALTCPAESKVEVRERPGDLGQAAAIEQRCVGGDGKAHGPFVVWSQDHLKQSSGEYDKGIQQGKWKNYRRDGSVASESVYLDGEVQEYFAYHQDGSKYLQSEYENGKMHGFVQKWHPNGNKMAEGQMKDNAKDGPWVWWYDDGQLEKRGNLRAGRKVGTWEAWDRDGNRLEDTIHTDEALPKVADRD